MLKASTVRPTQRLKDIQKAVADDSVGSWFHKRMPYG